MDVIIKQQCTYHAHWMKLVSSPDWFYMFLRYLNLKDIANLDTAFCSHTDRPMWLRLLNYHSIPVTLRIVNNIDFLMNMTDWLISKQIHLDKFCFQHSGDLVSNAVVIDGTISRLIQSNPNLKTIKIDNNSTGFVDMKVLFPCIAMFCTGIEYLRLRNAHISDNGLDSISITCHHLKHLKFSNARYDRIHELLKVSTQLLSLQLRPHTHTTALFGRNS